MLDPRTYLHLAPLPGRPVFVRLAEAFQQAIRQGVLAPGTALPSTRAVAQALTLNRNTVVAAYDELVGQGWIRARSTAGYFVAPTIPQPPARLAAPAAVPPLAPVGAGLMIETSPIPGLDDGLPDTRLTPLDLLGREYRRLLGQRARRCHLGYGDPRGQEALRRAVADWLRDERGFAPDPAEILITRGSQMALFLAVRALVRPGDVVAVEAPGYPPAEQVFRAAGAEICPVPVDEKGIRVDLLADAVRTRGVRLVYLTPHHQYPSTVTLSPCRRLELAALVRATDLAIIEDDYDHHFHYATTPVLPLKASDIGPRVAYVASFTKLLAPSLRVGYLVAPEAVIHAAAADRFLIDRTGDAILELALAEMLRAGDVRRFSRKANRLYAARRDAAALTLQAAVADRATVRVPAGGLAFWLAQPALPGGGLRVGFASATEAEFAELANRVAAWLGPIQ